MVYRGLPSINLMYVYYCIFGYLVALILMLLPHGLVEDDGEDDQDVTHEGDEHDQHHAEHLQSEMQLH